MAFSSSHEAASSSRGPVGETHGSKEPDELGGQINELKRQQQDLLREKKKLQAQLRNAQKKTKVDQTHADAERQRLA